MTGKRHAVALHGLGGTPASLGALPDVLRRSGWTVATPTLPGHGTTPDELAEVTRSEWHQAAEACVAAERTVVLGQSMGGLLALRLAATSEWIAGVVAINTPVTPPGPDAVEHLHWLLERGRGTQPVGPPDLADPDAVDDAYDELPVRSLLELASLSAEVHDLLPRVRVPVLVVTSAHDGVVDPANGELLAERVSGPVEQLLLPRSRHVACLDLDRELLAAEVVRWAARLAA